LIGEKNVTYGPWQRIAIIAIALLSAAASARAQQAAPAAIGQGLQWQQQRQLEQQQEFQKLMALGQDPGPTVTGTAPAEQKLRPAPGVSFELKKVTFNPDSSFLAPKELQAAVAPFLNRVVTFDDLNALLAAVNQLYAKRNLITARAVLPPQDIDNGEIEIRLIEGKLGQLKVANAKDIYTKADFITDQVPHLAGYPVDPNDLADSLNRFNRIFDIKTRAALTPGSSFGLTDIELTVIEPKRDSLDLFAANDGYQSTGQHSVGFYANHNGLLGYDDHLSAYMTGSAGAINGTGSYDIPFDESGGRVGISYSHGSIQVINGPTASLNSTGTTENGSINLTQPVWTDGKWLLLASGTTSVIHTENYTAGVLLNKSYTYKPGIGFNASLLEPGRSVTIAANAYLARNVPNSASGLPHRDFVVYAGTVSWIEQVTPDFAASINANWQESSSRSLPSDQLFQIGGPTTVRGYRQGLISGDGGYFSQLQGTYKLSSLIEQTHLLGSPLTPLLSDLSAYAFTDSGRAMTVQPEPKTMLSVGTGLLWNYTHWLSSDVGVGFPLSNVVANQNQYMFYFRLVAHVM
jgi:hemolysin activation/secretion protein